MGFNMEEKILTLKSLDKEIKIELEKIKKEIDVIKKVLKRK